MEEKKMEVAQPVKEKGGGGGIGEKNLIAVLG